VAASAEPRLLNGVSCSDSAPRLDWSDLFRC
jgi:hypothetical protein